MRAPGRKPMNAAGQRLPVEMAADELWKGLYLLRCLLHEEKIWLFSLH